MPTPNPTSSAAASSSVEDPRLDEVRERLAALDDVELSRHPEAFTAVDGLLRAALEGTDPGRS